MIRIEYNDSISIVLLFSFWFRFFFSQREIGKRSCFYRNFTTHLFRIFTWFSFCVCFFFSLFLLLLISIAFYGLFSLLQTILFSFQVTILVRYFFHWFFFRHWYLTKKRMRQKKLGSFSKSICRTSKAWRKSFNSINLRLTRKQIDGKKCEKKIHFKNGMHK